MSAPLKAGFSAFISLTSLPSTKVFSADLMVFLDQEKEKEI